MIRNIVLDMGNVLLDYDPYLPCLRHCVKEETANYLCDVIFRNPRWGLMIDGGVMDELQYLTDVQQKLPTAELKTLAARIMSDWWMDALYPKSGMRAFLEKLLEKGYKLYILSNCGHRFHTFEYRIPHLEAFSGILISAEEKLLKPDVAIFNLLCERYGLKAEECLFVDDLQKNVEGAIKAGMHGHCLADGDLVRLAAHLQQLEG